MALPQRNVPVESAKETRRTAQAIEDIAVEFSLPLSEVQEILQIHIHRLDQQARIKEYVSLLAVKQVKESLRTNRAEH